MTSPRARMPRSGVSEIQVLRPTGTTQKFTDGLNASQPTTNAVGTNVTRISTTVDICYEVNSSPTATTGDNFLPAGGVEYIKTIAGSDKVAVIAADGTTATGLVWIGEYE